MQKSVEQFPGSRKQCKDPIQEEQLIINKRKESKSATDQVHETITIASLATTPQCHFFKPLILNFHHYSDSFLSGLNLFNEEELVR